MDGNQSSRNPPYEIAMRLRYTHVILPCTAALAAMLILTGIVWLQMYARQAEARPLGPTGGDAGGQGGGVGRSIPSPTAGPSGPGRSGTEPLPFPRIPFPS